MSLKRRRRRCIEGIPTFFSEATRNEGSDGLVSVKRWRGLSGCREGRGSCLEQRRAKDGRLTAEPKAPARAERENVDPLL